MLLGKSIPLIVCLLLVVSCGVDIKKAESVIGEHAPSQGFENPDEDINSDTDTGHENREPYFEHIPKEGEEYESYMGYGFVSGSKAIAAALNINVLPDINNTDTASFKHLDMMKIPEVWAYGLSGKDVVVAVIDTGIDLYHEDLKDNIAINLDEIPGNGIDDDGNGYVDDVHGWDFFSKDNDPTDEKGHGTHVSGIIAAAKNGLGVTGVAYNAKILPIKVTGAAGSTSRHMMVPAIKYATMMGVDVINISMGGVYQPEVEQAIKEAHDSGIIVVMAAGNEGEAIPIYPARFSKQYGIAVGSGDPTGLDYFSNRAGEDILNYVVSPGKLVLSTIPDNKYEKKSGTSMASPNVAGLAALIIEASPNLSVEEKIAAITSTALHPALTTTSSYISSNGYLDKVVEMPTYTK